MAKSKPSPRKLVPMISLKTMEVISTLGHSVRFVGSPKGLAEPHITNVHPAIVQECLAKGAMVVDSGDQPFIDENAKIKAAFAPGELRTSIVFLVMQRMKEQNNAKLFTSGGIPKAEVVSQMLGFDVTDKEMKTLWQQFQSAVNGDKELDVDPRAKLALDVMDAANVDELKMVASEMNVPTDETDGLTTKDLKQLLLSKFA